MELYNTPADYMYNLEVVQSRDAKRLWRKKIKEQWSNKCAYCESSDDLTLDHVIPRSHGGSDTTKNVVCCCKNCNQSKGHTDVEQWFRNQSFFTEEKLDRLNKWTVLEDTKNRYVFNRKLNSLVKYRDTIS